jgi:hypothetical protein
MKNGRLCGLAMISIEHEVGQELTKKKLVDDFVKLIMVFVLRFQNSFICGLRYSCYNDVVI